MRPLRTYITPIERMLILGGCVLLALWAWYIASDGLNPLESLINPIAHQEWFGVGLVAGLLVFLVTLPSLLKERRAAEGS